MRFHRIPEYMRWHHDSTVATQCEGNINHELSRHSKDLAPSMEMIDELPYGKFPHVNVTRFREEVLEWWATLDFLGITAKSRKCPGYFSWTLSPE